MAAESPGAVKLIPRARRTVWSRNPRAVATTSCRSHPAVAGKTSARCGPFPPATDRWMGALHW